MRHQGPEKAAFPNAYIEVDEPHRVSGFERGLAVVGALGTAYFGLTILFLSAFDGDYSPISQVASDYGVGRFAFEMNLGFVVGGIGLVAFALAYSQSRDRRKSRFAPILFVVAGLLLLVDSYFTTDLEGGASTLHGMIHNIAGVPFFVVAPIAAILVMRQFSRLGTVLALIGLAAGFVLLAANAGAGGLAERVILLVVFVTVVLASTRLIGGSLGSKTGTPWQGST